MKNILSSVILLIVITLVSCSKDEPAPSTAPKALSYGESPIATTFYSEGTSDAPVVSWGNIIGTFSFDQEYPGFSIDAITGKISWTKTLNLGDHIVTVIATNDLGSIETEVILSNGFNAQFNGGYNNNIEFEEISHMNQYNMTFTSDGTMSISGQSSAAGTWTFSEEGKITATYTYVGGGTFMIEGNLTYSEEAAPVITGFWKGSGDATWKGKIYQEFK